MSQFTHGTIDPDTKDGTQLALDIASEEGAQNTNHSGASRPSYAVAGMTWIKTVSSTQHEWYYYDGTDDLLIGTFDPTNNVWKLSAIGYGGVASNTVIGTDALSSNTTGSNCIAFGTEALKNNTVASYKIAIGYQSQYTSTTGGQYNIGIGYQALYSSTSSAFNTAVGAGALYSTNTSGGHSALGYLSLYSNTTGSSNTSVGSQSLYSNTTGSSNTSVGYFAGHGASPYSLANTTGSNNTFLGYQAVGASSTASNTITLGNSSITTLRCQVTSITSLSDERDKTNISTLQDSLTFINSLNPISFIWNMRDGGKLGILDTGFIAQDLQKSQQDNNYNIPGLVYDENPERLEAAYAKLIPTMVKAIQELSNKVEIQQQEINSLKGLN